MNCRRCYGRGKLFMGPDAVLIVCPDCKGTGVEPDEDCTHDVTSIESVGGGESVRVCSQCGAVQYNDGTWAL